MRSVAAVALGCLAAFAAYVALALIATYALRSHHVGRGEISIVGEVVMLAIASASTALGSFLSLRIQAQPWWRAPAVIGVLAASYFFAAYAAARAFVPFLWVLVCVAALSPLVVAFSVSRSIARRGVGVSVC